MRNKQQLRKDFQSAQHPLSPPKVNSGGTAPSNERAAAHFFWKNIMGQSGINDNKQRSALPKLRMVFLIVATFVCGAVLGAKASSIATQAVLQADERILVTAMDTSPEMLGSVLNAMNVGE